VNVVCFEKKILEISKVIKSSKTFFIAGHVKPDGDSIGSSLALASVLNRTGKKTCVCCADRVPDFLKFLKGINKVKMSVKKTDLFDCAIILESNSFLRMGNIITPNQSRKIINIDHHYSSTNFGTINYIVPSSSSTAELVLNIFEYMKIELTKNEAESLYTGILTDTGCFQQINTTFESHIAAAKLMKYGISVNKIYGKIYGNTSINALKLQGLALCNMKTIFNGQFSYVILTKNMFKKSGAKDGDSESIVNYGLKIKGVKVSCAFKEINKKSTKISCRSVKGFNLLDIVRIYGGGGHKNAAGCVINENVETSIKMISSALKEKFDGKKL
jgi:phosphoesterase RecJ-like protein